MEQKALFVPCVLASPPGLASCWKDSSSVSTAWLCSPAMRILQNSKLKPLSGHQSINILPGAASQILIGSFWAGLWMVHSQQRSSRSEPKAEPFVDQQPPPLPVTVSSVWAGTRTSSAPPPTSPQELVPFPTAFRYLFLDGLFLGLKAELHRMPGQLLPLPSAEMKSGGPTVPPPKLRFTPSPLRGVFSVYSQTDLPSWLWTVFPCAAFPLESTPPNWSPAITALAAFYILQQ